jgi:oligosaccharide repeat unit polymerase
MILSGYIFGMVASRSALIVVLCISLVIYIYRYTDRKKLIVFLALFLLVQLLTPQTQVRIGQFFNRTYIEEEVSGGRPLIWKAAFLAFKTSPVIGIGSCVFFEESTGFINTVLQNQKEEDSNPMRAIYYLRLDHTNPHSIFFTMLTEYGIIGLMIFVIFLIVQYRNLIRKRMILSISFISGLLFVSMLSNYAPYYRAYHLICILVFALSEKNMLRLNYSKQS